jgi:hypothetical protein
VERMSLVADDPGESRDHPPLVSSGALQATRTNLSTPRFCVSPA